MDSYNSIPEILSDIRIALLGEPIYNRCSNGLPLKEDELIKIVKEAFNLSDEDEDIINDAKNNFIRLCKLKIQNPYEEIPQLKEVELRNSEFEFEEYEEKIKDNKIKETPIYIQKLFEHTLPNSNNAMFSFGKIKSINPVFYHGSPVLFQHPFLLNNIVNRLTFNVSMAKNFAIRKNRKFGFIYAYSLNKNIENIIQYNGIKGIKDVNNKIEEQSYYSYFPKQVSKSEFTNPLIGDEYYVRLCESKDYINKVNGIFAQHIFNESQLILCRDGKVKLYLKDIYIVDSKTKKIYQLL